MYDVWMGTTVAFVDGGIDHGIRNFYDNDSTGDCRHAGTLSLLMNALALVLASVSLVTNTLQLTGHDSFHMQLRSVYRTLGAASCALVAFVVYQGCIDSFADNISENHKHVGAEGVEVSLAYGAAAWLVFSGFMLMLLAGVLNGFVLLYCKDTRDPVGYVKQTRISTVSLSDRRTDGHCNCLCFIYCVCILYVSCLYRVYIWHG
jgi:hypothetical protein